jgi:tRNA A-37 threonylcarbamoyl transferase component Bud32
MKRLLVFMIFLWVTDLAKADSLVTIGQTTKVIKSSTSCDAKNWESSQLNSCACCLTKENDNSPASPDKIVGVCLKGKYCTVKILNQLAPGQTSAEDIINVVLWGIIDTPNITIKADYLDKKGNLRPEKIADFLVGLKKDLRDLNAVMQADFANVRCLDAKDLGAGGANTAQLFMVKVDKKCSRNSTSPPAPPVPAYIIKETVKKTDEIKNLRRLHQSILKKDYDLLSPNRLKSRLAIAFDELNIKYMVKGKSRYLSFITIAPGQSLINLSKVLGDDINKGDTAAEHRDADQLYKAFYAVGTGLGELHKRFMDKGTGTKLLGKTIIHGDLHLNNIFIDPAQNNLVTLIDNETFAKSLKEKRPVAIDLLVFYAFTVAHFKDIYLFPSEIGLTKWNNVMLKPFLLSYISNWPPSNREQLLSELKDILTNPAKVIKLVSDRPIIFNILKYQGKIKDIARVFAEVSKS